MTMEKRGPQVPIELPVELQQESDAQALTENADKVSCQDFLNR